MFPMLLFREALAEVGSCEKFFFFSPGTVEVGWGPEESLSVTHTHTHTHIADSKAWKALTHFQHWRCHITEYTRSPKVPSAAGARVFHTWQTFDSFHLMWAVIWTLQFYKAM